MAQQNEDILDFYQNIGHNGYGKKDYPVIFYFHDGQKIFSYKSTSLSTHNTLDKGLEDKAVASGRIDIDERIGSIGIYDNLIKDNIINVLYDIKEKFPEIQFYVYTNDYAWHSPFETGGKNMLVDQYIKQLSQMNTKTSQNINTYLDIGHIPNDFPVIFYIHDGKHVIKKESSDRNTHMSLFGNAYKNAIAIGRIDIKKNIGSVEINEYSKNFRQDKILDILYDIKEAFPGVNLLTTNVLSDNFDISLISLDQYIQQLSIKN